MNTIKTSTSKLKETSKEKRLEARKVQPEKVDEIRKHRDELTRSLLADYVESALVHMIAGT